MSAGALTKFQLGFESTRGTAVAATRPLYMRGELPIEKRPPEYITQERGDFNEYHDSVQPMIHAEAKLEGEFNYQEAPVWMCMALKGGLTPTGAGPYVWTADSESTSDDLDSITLEGGDNVAAVEMPFGMCGSWEIAGADGKGPKVITHKMDLIGQKVVPTTLTGAISALDQRGSYAHMTQAQVFVDTAAGSIGGTEWSNALMAFSIKGDNKLSPNYTGGNSALFSSVDRDNRHIEVMIDLLLNATLYSAWQSSFQANALRFCRLKLTGSGDDYFQFDFATRFESFEWKRGNGTRRVVLLGKTLYDPDLGHAWECTVQNDIASL